MTQELTTIEAIQSMYPSATNSAQRIVDTLAYEGMKVAFVTTAVATGAAAGAVSGYTRMMAQLAAAKAAK